MILLSALCIALLFFRLIGKNRKSFESDSSLINWMSKIDDNTKVIDVVIPGSHDAGTKGTIWAAETQNCTIKEQLEIGTRYFDLRVEKKSDKLVMFHKAASGMDFKPVMSWIKDFIIQHPSEFLLLDFQHFKGNSQLDVARVVMTELCEPGLLIGNTNECSDLDFVRNLTVGEVRGKCIVFWGDESPLPNQYFFSRNTNECTMDYACLDSYYIASIHRKSTEELISMAHPIYFQREAKLKKINKNCVFVLQCQLTDRYVIRGPWFLERRNDGIMTEYINSIKDSNYLSHINVIMRDFLTSRKCRDIIDLNIYKNNYSDFEN